ncbi:T9SS type A sorting domain-containing protein [Hymenobacter wooponensis]|uniref:T9SS type A sorting domain-containing protein n=1 Tax=Hymenobacter wooponensis TaxID=1525360 RepID=A0A4Z0MHE5_9BACT|nr:T9SS type A sorting domain-containing protein [Hymenobacter wooponensis]TGD78770.1 T9SS type A sorting domain-containing protein [Hymenobacter wooponensis]
MKSILRVVTAALVGLLYSATALAQTAPTVTNGAMETWVTRTSGEAPQGWLTIDDIIPFTPLAQLASFLIPSGTVTKSTSVHGGSFAAQLQTVAKSTPVGEGLLPGRMILGSRINPNTNNYFGGGIPYTSRPSRMQFWYKLTGANALTDSAAVFIVLSKTQGSDVKDVAFNGYLLTPTPTYQLYDFPITYEESIAPDTLELYFTSGTAEKITAGTTLSVDDITLTGTVTASRNPASEAVLQIYPNPSKGGEFSLASLGNAAIATAPFVVSDITGREVLRQTAVSPAHSHGRLVDLRGQRPGLYTLRLQTPDGPVVRKLVVE